jgi:hypothetical protein
VDVCRDGNLNIDVEVKPELERLRAIAASARVIAASYGAGRARERVGNATRRISNAAGRIADLVNSG